MSSRRRAERSFGPGFARRLQRRFSQRGITSAAPYSSASFHDALQSHRRQMALHCAASRSLRLASASRASAREACAGRRAATRARQGGAGTRGSLGGTRARRRTLLWLPLLAEGSFAGARTLGKHEPTWGAGRSSRRGCSCVVGRGRHRPALARRSAQYPTHCRGRGTFRASGGATEPEALCPTDVQISTRSISTDESPLSLGTCLGPLSVIAMAAANEDCVTAPRFPESMSSDMVALQKLPARGGPRSSSPQTSATHR